LLLKAETLAYPTPTRAQLFDLPHLMAQQMWEHRGQWKRQDWMKLLRQWRQRSALPRELLSELRALEGKSAKAGWPHRGPDCLRGDRWQGAGHSG